METFPTRLVNLEDARRLHPAELSLLGPALTRTDPLADRVVEDARMYGVGRLFQQLPAWLRGEPLPDDAPDSFADLVAFSRAVPSWVELERLRSGAEFFLSTHALGGIVLGARSLVSGYAAPAGNKPLALSGRLEGGVNKRLGETSQFVYDVCKPGNFVDGGPGVAAAVKVRIIHAHVRAMIRRHAKWSDDWGSPINQHDMAGTVLLFSLVLLEGLEFLGIKPSRDEAEDYLHLWRYVGYLLGVERALLPTNRVHAERMKAFIDLTQGAPDEDARRLTRAFLEASAAVEGSNGPPPAAGQILARALMGDEMADHLAIPRHRGRHVLPLVRGLVRQANVLRRIAYSRAVAAGDNYWQWVLENDPSGSTELTLPSRLLRTAVPLAG